VSTSDRQSPLTGSRERRSQSSLLAEIRVEVVGRLRTQAAEIEDAIRVRAFAVADLSGHEEPGYREGLRAAIGAAIAFALGAIETGEHRVGPLPREVVVQARAAVRSRVALAIVLRRYAAGYSVLSDFLQRELHQGHLEGPEAFSALQRELTALFDRLVAEVSAEFQQESERLSAQSATSLRIRRLLAAEVVDLGDLNYQFDGWHLAAVAVGHAAEDQLRTLARGLGRRWLLAEFDGMVAVWIGGGEFLEGSTLIAATSSFDGLSVGIGGPATGLRGWRSTLRQAETALGFARCGRRPVVDYADVAIVASALEDDDLCRFLATAYLEPLARERDAGETLRRTLDAFFASGWNATSAAATLGVARQTITSRLRAYEEHIGRPLESCGTEVSLALRLFDQRGGLPWPGALRGKGT
jgi:hypothetical protein